MILQVDEMTASGLEVVELRYAHAYEPSINSRSYTNELVITPLFGVVADPPGSRSVT